MLLVSKSVTCFNWVDPTIVNNLNETISFTCFSICRFHVTFAIHFEEYRKFEEIQLHRPLLD